MAVQMEISHRRIPLKTPLGNVTVKERLEKFAKETPDKEACVVYDLEGNRSSITCAELLHKSRLFARGLSKFGIKTDNIVAISLPNGPCWMICTFGVQLMGAVPMLFMFYRHDGVDVANALAKSDHCTAVIFDPGHDDINWTISGRFIQNVDEDAKVKCDRIPTLKFAILSRKPNSRDKMVTFDDILILGQDHPDAELPELNADGLAAILLSSGTTGTPKAIQYTHTSLQKTGRDFGIAYDMKDTDVYMNASSFNWGAAYPFVFLEQGSTRVTTSDVLSFKSLGDMIKIIVKAIAQEKCTIALLNVPSVLEMIENNRRSTDWASSLVTVASAGGPVPSKCSKILDKFAQYFVVVYGCTEVGAISGLRILKGEKHENYCIGIPFPGFEVKVVDDAGEKVPVNTVGELYVKHCIGELGYHNDKDGTMKVFTEDGWYKTDDMGCMRSDGTFIVSGRKSDMILLGESLVSPSYLESFMLSHPGIKDVVIVSVADDETFQQPCACIITKEGYELSEVDLKEFFKKEFAVISEYRGFLPKYFLFFETFPKTQLNKLSRKLIQSIAAERVSNR